MPNPIINEYGTKRWYNEYGLLHREYGPAIEYDSGYKVWYLHGVMHRDDGPAYDTNNYKCWYQNGKLHREDGPACEYVNGDKEYYLNGVRYTEEEFLAKTKG